MSALQFTLKTSSFGIRGLDSIQWVLLLALRLWLAKVFFMSGLTKIQSWETTLMLFQYEYAVPFISASMAAVLATGVELVVPVLLVLGLSTRINIVVLFVLNVIAAISYPDISPAGEKDHIMWGLACAMLLFYGPGAASIDYIVRRKWLEPVNETKE
ncbi:MAG: DoxX family membrane protein [Pseudomonadales bacterium]|nr:DoxX family membrane protein [Pseudomonadales bacterium]